MIVKVKKKFSLKDLGKTEHFSATFFIRSVVAVTLLVAFVGTMRYFEIDGSKEAIRIIEQYKKNAFLDSDFENKLVRIKNEKSVDTLFIVDCGSEICAGISVAEGRVVYFNKKSQKKFVSKNLIVQNKTVAD